MNYNEDENILKTYLKEINKIPLITPQQEAVLVSKAQKGDSLAREELLNSHLRFVVTVAKKYQGQGIPLIDLINEGNIGLITALDKFDPTRGYHFISYAVWWIRQSILKAINEKSRMIRLPMNLTNHLVQIEKVMKELQLESYSKESASKVADILCLDEGKVKLILEASKDPLSLNSPLEVKKEDSQLQDIVEDEKYPHPEDAILKDSLKTEIKKAFSKLSPKEAQVLEYRFGLNGYHPMSLKEIAEIFDLTKERIRQIEMRALARLKKGAGANLEAYVA